MNIGGFGAGIPGGIAGGPAGFIGAYLGGAIAGGAVNLTQQFGDNDGDGIPNHSDPYPGYPTDEHNDQDGDGIPDHDDPDYDQNQCKSI